MDSLFFSLIQVLGQEREILAEMLVEARKHNVALRQNDAEALRDVTGREEMLAGLLKPKDRRREEIHAGLEAALGLPAGTPLSGLLPSAPEQHRERLSQITVELREIVREVARLVELNSILTRRAMHFNEQILRLVKPGYTETYQSFSAFSIPAGSQPLLINKTF